MTDTTISGNKACYVLDERKYHVRNCTPEDIPSHIGKVSVYWETANMDEQTMALQRAVDDGTAWKLEDEEGELQAVIYCIRMTVDKAMSNLLWLKNKLMFSILCYHIREKVRLAYIYFLPHTDTFIPFKFVVEDYSTRLFHSHGEPLEIYLYSPKCTRLYEKHYLKHGVQEL